MSKCARSSGVFLLLVVLIGFPLVIRLEAVDGPRAVPEREARKISAERYDRPERERVFRDYWVTPPDGPEGGTYQDVTIPVGFFGPECDGFEGRVHFVGSPLDPGTTGNADTVLERSADPVSARDAEGTTGTVTLWLTELSLVSKEPIAVACDDGLSLWHIHVGLSSEAPWAGWLTATKTHEDGGTFDSTVYVQPLLTFTNVDDPEDMLVFDMGDVSDPAELVAAEVPFVLRVGGSIARDDPDSVSGENVASEFIPGIAWTTDSQRRMDDTDEQVLQSVQETTPLVGHQAPGHQHCVEPPTGACCNNEGNCTITTQVECPGEYIGNGTHCGPPDPCKCRVEITSADICVNKIATTLGPPNDEEGVFTLTLISADGNVELVSETRSGGASYSDDFNIDTLPERRYTQIKATWNPPTGQCQDTYDYDFKNLGTYEHTFYNLPDEDTPECTGNAQAFCYTTGDCRITPCTWKTDGSGKSLWISEVNENGSGKSTQLGFVTREWFCQNSSNPAHHPPAECKSHPLYRDLNAGIEGCGSCVAETPSDASDDNVAANETVARKQTNADLPCGAKVYIHDPDASAFAGCKMVTDSGEKLGDKQLDHYAGVAGCNVVPDDNKNFITIRIYSSSRGDPDLENR